MEDKSNKIAYVVLSCDPYSDIWETYGILFNRFWPDCPYDKYLASHHKSFDKYGFKPLLLGEDLSWSHGLMIVLDVCQQKGYDYVMVAFDDFLLSEKVDNDYVTSAINTVIEEGGDYLQFDPKRNTRCYKHNKYYGKMWKKVPYRVTLGFALWKISVLKQLVVEGESAWQFEKKATERSFTFTEFYCTWKEPIKHINLVNKRKLDVAEYKRLLKILPDAKFDRDQIYVKKEKIKGIILQLFLRYFPIKWQYQVYKKLSRPINM